MKYSSQNYSFEFLQLTKKKKEKKKEEISNRSFNKFISNDAFFLNQRQTSHEEGIEAKNHDGGQCDCCL